METNGLKITFRLLKPVLLSRHLPFTVMKPALRLLLFVALSAIPTAVRAQTAQALSPLRNEQNPCGAISVCTTTWTTDSSYTGPGSTATAHGCMSESNSVWLRIDVVQSGNIVFTLSPQNTLNDYDFAVFQATNCNNLGAPIRCNANNNNAGSNVNGQIGLNTTSLLTNVPGGTFGNSYLAQINAVAPATYYIVIDNALSGYFPAQIPDGFTIDFTGSTALFTKPPAFDSVARTCNTTQGITVLFDGPIVCDSLASNGSDFVISPALATVTGAVGVGCPGTTSTVNLTFSNPLPPGIYTLKPQAGTDGNAQTNPCGQEQLLTDSIQFEVVAPITVNAGPDKNICIGMSTTLAGSFTGGGAVNTISWTPAATLTGANTLTPTATPTTNTTYTLTVAPASLPSCAVTDQVNIGVLQGFNINTPNTTICRGGSVPISVTGDPRYTYLWTPPTGLSSTTTPNTTATPDTTRSYILRATYPGCPDSTQSILITVEPVPVVNAGRDTILCFDQRLMLRPQVSPTWFTQYSYSWTPAQEFLNPMVLNTTFLADTTTTATLTVTTPNGCVGSDAVVLTVVPKFFSEISADTAICPLDTAQLRAGAGVRYIWSPGYSLSADTVAQPTAFPTVTTVYTVITTSVEGCRDTQQVQVRVFPAAVLSLPDSIRLHPGEVTQFDPGGNCVYFAWTPPIGLSSPSVANPVVNPPVNTRYFVEARTEWGCPTRDSIDVYVDPETWLDVPNAFTPGSAPNAVFRPERRGLASITYFRIFNRWGQKVFETSTLDAGWDGTYGGQPQPMGVYVWEIDATTANGRRVRKQGNVTLLR